MSQLASSAVKEVLITRDEIRERVAEIGRKISEDYAETNVLLICVLKGAVFFLSDLVREITSSCEIDFIAVSSYGSSTKSTGVVRMLKDLDAPIEGRDILIVEDIVDTGLTLSFLMETLQARKPNSIEIATLLSKPSRREVEMDCRYVGFEIPNRFVVGYGLDYAERFRNLQYIGCLDEDDLPEFG